MAKFHGALGYEVYEENPPGVYAPIMKERDAVGDILYQYRARDGSDQINDDIRLNHRISIVADGFWFEHYFFIKYVKIQGVAWKVSSIELRKPRIILDVGGIYNNALTT